MDVWPSIVRSNWIPWRPPPRSPLFLETASFLMKLYGPWMILGLRLKSRKKIPKRKSGMREVTSYFLKFKWLQYSIWSLLIFQIISVFVVWCHSICAYNYMSTYSNLYSILWFHPPFPPPPVEAVSVPGLSTPKTLRDGELIPFRKHSFHPLEAPDVYI